MVKITIVLLVFCWITPGLSKLLQSPTLTPIVRDGYYGEHYVNTLNKTMEYVFLYSDKNHTSDEGARITVRSNDATQDYPLIVVVQQKKGILSWQIPLLVNGVYSGTLAYNLTSRTLCSTKYYRLLSSGDDDEEFVTVSISTTSRKNITFELTVEQIQDFYITFGETKTKLISPSEPIYWGYNFTDELPSSSVVVRIESDSDICMTVSIQNTSCPVFDLERNIQFSGLWQTVSKLGGITVAKEDFPLGFFIVLVVKSDDYDCNNAKTPILPRNKNVSVFINATVTKDDYIIASSAAVSLVAGFCIIYLIGIIVYNVKEGKKLIAETRERREEQEEDEERIREHAPSRSTIDEVCVAQSYAYIVEEDSSLDEVDIDMLEDALSDKDVIRTKLILHVSDLARKTPTVLRHKSHLYLYYLLTISIFYTLPVVQLVLTYQNVLHVTGNQDLCYYNFLCSHPLLFLSDFNHVFSNFGYVTLGLLFIYLTYRRDKADKNNKKSTTHGIPRHYGFFYAMGTALMMEGVLSASYHVCPNHSNFQFDTSFMYVIALMCMMKIYQSRHPDINASAPMTFGVLALIIVFGLTGVLYGTVPFRIGFTVIHLTVCLLLSATIYYMGRWKLNAGLFRRIYMVMRHDLRSGIWHFFTPIYKGRLVLLMFGNLCNVGLAILGYHYHDKDFATYLLAVLMSNLLLYTFFYIFMKLCNRERPKIRMFIYLFLSFLAWGAALYFFIHKTISWALTPAQSRMYNRPCQFLNFYDSHDVWHFLSALAMFFSFMVLLTMDDDLVEVHRDKITVF